MARITLACHPKAMRCTLHWTTVNALVIGSDHAGQEDLRQVDIAELTAYFRTTVIRGPGTFLQVAIGYTDYEGAMARKPLREVGLVIVGQIQPVARALTRSIPLASPGISAVQGASTARWTDPG
ncbi:DUF1194 domain-containing protein [Actibacterium sp. 188UL27-1]|uniref:DUF1194 domain-containing protein n=1 Tax=Actibacterium sp. 188UL27-1 TaxID=2786961 RepID=UPI001EF6BAA7|nr:DUF1194 domain-containing protein [Actibacterium sp. 188UL27-1]